MGSMLATPAHHRLRLQTTACSREVRACCQCHEMGSLTNAIFFKDAKFSSIPPTPSGGEVADGGDFTAGAVKGPVAVAPETPCVCCMACQLEGRLAPHIVTSSIQVCTKPVPPVSHR